MLSGDLEKRLNEAFKQAKIERHEYLTVEHLLLALLREFSVAEMLSACGCDIEQLRQELQGFLDETVSVFGADEVDRDTQPTLSFQRVLQRAVFHVQSSGYREVTCANVLIAIFSEQDSRAVLLLKEQNITRLEVVNYVSNDLSYDEKDTHQMMEEPEMGEAYDETDVPMANKSVLDLYTVNLNERAKQGEIDPLIGRELEVERVVQVICRRGKNNPLLVGEAGVGKTAIAEGLAKKIIDGEVPDAIKSATVYSLDLGALLAGTKYRGDFEKRLKAVLKQLQESKDTILLIDEIHTIIGAGAAAGGAMDASNIIKPLLTKGNMCCIGSTTYTEYYNIFEKDYPLARRFQKIDVEEPSVEQTYHILKGLRPFFESHHGVTYTDMSLHAAADLSAKHITDRFLPDKAVDVIDEAGAHHCLSGKKEKTKQVDVKEVEEVVANMARIPTKRVSASDKQSLKNLDRNLKMLVYGQDEAIDMLTSAIKLARAGLRDANKPWGSFLFAGPTGVGKTEVTQQLANLLGIELLRFDMSEYVEQHTVSRLIGAPPGYIGFEQGGLLTDAVIKNPYAILLLDEMEKAHPDVYNLMLQVMDNGFLTDSNGRKVDFRHVVVVMTTNAGAQEGARNTMGFVGQDHQTDSMAVINRIFSPEFRNRLDAVIQFKTLSQEVIRNVVDKFIIQLQGQLDESGVTIEADDSSRSWLARHGYDEKMGARPMARVIQEYIKQPLAEEILFGKLTKGGCVKIYEEEEAIRFEYLYKQKNKKRKTNTLKKETTVKNKT